MLLAACVPLGTLPAISVSAATSGVTGDCTWTLDGTHLTISGNGAMRNYTSESVLPWGKAITSVTIEDGVTTIGNSAWEPVWFETVSGTVTVLETAYGDADGDGNVNNRDLALMQQYLNGWDVTLGKS